MSSNEVGVWREEVGKANLRRTLVNINSPEKFYDAEIREEVREQVVYFCVTQVEIDPDDGHRIWQEHGQGFEGFVDTYEQAEKLVEAAARILAPGALQA